MTPKRLREIAKMLRLLSPSHKWTRGMYCDPDPECRKIYKAYTREANEALRMATELNKFAKEIADYEVARKRVTNRTLNRQY